MLLYIKLRDESMIYFLYGILILIGTITGVITSLVGASAVTLIVPALSMLFHVNVHTAIGTSLFVDVITSIVVSYNYYRKGHVELKSGLWIAVASVIGAQFGANIANATKGVTLSGLFGILLIFSGINELHRSKKQTTERKRIKFKHQWTEILSAILIGIAIGIISGIFGAGGGVMILLALIIILGYPMHMAVGTSTLIMAVTALSSDIGYFCHGHIDFLFGILLSLGAVFGGIFGSKYANKINDKVLSKVLNVFFIIIGIIMLIQAFI